MEEHLTAEALHRVLLDLDFRDLPQNGLRGREYAQVNRSRVWHEVRVRFSDAQKHLLVQAVAVSPRDELYPLGPIRVVRPAAHWARDLRARVREMHEMIEQTPLCPVCGCCMALLQRGSREWKCMDFPCPGTARYQATRDDRKRLAKMIRRARTEENPAAREQLYEGAARFAHSCRMFDAAEKIGAERYLRRQNPEAVVVLVEKL